MRARFRPIDCVRQECVGLCQLWAEHEFEPLAADRGSADLDGGLGSDRNWASIAMFTSPHTVT